MHRASFGQPYPPNGGRSPYAAYAQTTVNDRDLTDLYGYVDDDHNVLSPSGRYGHAVEDDEAPDIVHISYRGELWAFEFPPYSIAESKVTVRHVRDRVALRLQLKGEEGRVKLIYKDRELKHNDVPLRKYGCKQNSEITVIVLTEPRDYDRPSRRNPDSDSDSVASSRRSAEDQRPRRSLSNYRKRDPRDLRDSRDSRDARDPRERDPRDLRDARDARDARDSRDSEPRSAYPSNGHLHPHGTPSNTPPRQQSPIRPNASTSQRPPRGPSPSARSSPPISSPINVQPPQADLSTDLGKIQNMRYKFHTKWVPIIQNFIKSPPPDRDDRDKEYRRLSEITYKEVFADGDAIEPDGPDKEEIRATRKKLYAEANSTLKDLDRYKPKESK